MNKNSLGRLALLTATLVAGFAMAADTGPIGDWEGKLDTGNGILKVVVHISAAATAGKLTGTLDSPDQGATGIVMNSVTYKDPDLHLEIESIGGAFDGKMSKDNCEVPGEWKQGGGSAPLTFKRRGCAQK